MQETWTTERVEKLTKLWADGLSCSQIAMQMDCGLSRNAIIGKVYRLGLNGRVTRVSTQQRYRSGPVSYEEKARREAERLARKMIAQAQRRVRQEQRPPTFISEPSKPVEFLAITFGELNREHCRYPRGEGAEITFCGQPATHGSYCAYCYGITHYGPRDITPNARAHWVNYLTRKAA